MAIRFRILLVRCEECGRANTFRRPSEKVLVTALPHLACPLCHPEQLDGVCAACRFPFAVVPHHADGMCFACYQSLRRYRKALQNTARS